MLEDDELDLRIHLFVKAVDFGWHSFVTRPLFFVLCWLSSQLGRFGMALLTFAVIGKVACLPLTIKQMRMTWKTSRLKPQVDLIRARHKDDPVAMQQPIMMLYRKVKVSLFGGFLPLFIQAPVFWCLYKDLYVTIEMRHAPFVGWVKDLSAQDPTNIFNLFGLLPFAVPAFLMIGVWPIIMGITMFLQMRMNPTPPDPTQAMIFTWMPIIFTFMLASFPAGLVIYWAWNNTLSITQQGIIMKRQGVKIELFDNLKDLFKRKPKEAKK